MAKGKLYKGFLHLQCDHCGDIFDTCLKQEQDSLRCRKCGHTIKLTRSNMQKADLHCECGKRMYYWTNRTGAMFDMTCIECGSPVAVEWHWKKKRYVTIKEW